jgi:hypothetical protein
MAVLFIGICYHFPSYSIHESRLGHMIFGAVSLFGLLFGVHILYVYRTYYKRDKDVQLQIDYEKKELRYMKNEKLLRTFNFDEIDVIETSHRDFPRGIYTGYIEFCLKDNTTIIITSLIITDIHKLFPRKKFPDICIERSFTWSLIP